MDSPNGARRRRRSYSQEMKEQIISFAEQHDVPAAEAKFGCPRRTIYGWLQRRRATTNDPSSQPSESETSVEKEKQAEGDAQRASHGRRYSPAEKALILEAATKYGIAEAARRYDPAAWTIRRWVKHALRRKQGQQVSLPGHDGLQKSVEQEERHRLVLATWKRNPGFGPTQIRNQLHRQGYKISVHSTRDIMEEHGYVQPIVRRKEKKEPYEAARPRQLYHLDFLHFYVHKIKQCLLLIEDDFSRFIVGWALLKSEHAAGVIEAFDASIQRYGKPEGVMYDRGSAFFSFRGISKFERILAEYSIDNFPVAEASSNGKVEALNATVRKELLTQVEFADLDDAVKRIDCWVDGYNYRRTHMALGGLLVPADRFHGLAELTMRRIEEGKSADLLDLVEPKDRTLDFFRVTSNGGELAAYLMGKKIL